MRIGAHVDRQDPLAAAAERKAEVVQFFLSDPQAWVDPEERSDADALKASDVDVFINPSMSGIDPFAQSIGILGGSSHRSCGAGQ